MTKPIKVLNLYSGIGGNRLHWENVQVTAVDIHPTIAELYKTFFPEDTVLVGNARNYLIHNYREFKFIWASPPCPTHSRIRKCGIGQKGFLPVMPDFGLYEIITFLQHHYHGKWVVENVQAYYKPLIKPQVIDRHWFWANFRIPSIKVEKVRHIRGEKVRLKGDYGFKLPKSLPHEFRRKLLNNIVHPDLGKHILETALKSPQRRLI
jgi:DNA (cytosine-5)-methyltransferase 1